MQLVSFKLNKPSFYEVKDRLETILANKELISGIDLEREEYKGNTLYLKSDIGIEYSFVLGQGLCTNGDLWLLDYRFDLGNDSKNYAEIMDYRDDSCITFMDKLGINFCLEHSKRFDEDGIPHCVSPIYRKSHKLWQDEMRWKYVEFCLEKVNYVLETENNPF